MVDTFDVPKMRGHANDDSDEDGEPPAIPVTLLKQGESKNMTAVTRAASPAC